MKHKTILVFAAGGIVGFLVSRYLPLSRHSAYQVTIERGGGPGGGFEEVIGSPGEPGYEVIEHGGGPGGGFEDITNAGVIERGGGWGGGFEESGYPYGYGRHYGHGYGGYYPGWGGYGYGRRTYRHHGWGDW